MFAREGLGSGVLNFRLALFHCSGQPLYVSKAGNQSSEAGEGTQMRPQRSGRRTVPWLLAGTVAVLLAIIVAQQLLNLGSVVPPETGSDTLLLYALSSLNFGAFWTRSIGND